MAPGISVWGACGWGGRSPLMTLWWLTDVTPLPLRSDSAALVIHSLLRDPNVGELHPQRTLDALGLYLLDNNIRHFSAREVVQLSTRGGVTNTVPVPQLWANIVPTIHALEWLRQEYGGRPIHINSGYRSEQYNLAVGGAPNSLHRRFGALDFWIRDVDPGDIAATLETHTDSHQFGLGTYAAFNHLDCRGLLGMDAPARWDERKRAA